MAYDWEVSDEITKPCIHAEPQAASCLHGVCIFCWRDRCAALRARVAELEDVLLRGGFTRCDIPACNCGSWHHRYGLPERMQEIKDALAEADHPLDNGNGNLPINALAELVADRDALRARVAELEEEQACVDEATDTRLRHVNYLIARAEKAEAANATLTATNATLREALGAIAKGEGPFSRDPYTHACNCIDAMKGIATAALAATPDALAPQAGTRSRLEMSAIRYVDAETAYADCNEPQYGAARRERDAAWQELICARANAAEPEADHTSVAEIKPCPGCGGNGSVPSRIMWGGGFLREACPTCNGIGVADEPNECQDCHGASGWFDDSGNLVDCPRCTRKPANTGEEADNG